MCTSIAMKTKDFYFGRNLDLEWDFGQRVVITPRRYPLPFRKAAEMRQHYAIIGMANVSDGYPLYAEAANEYGLCMAGLNFPEYAYYPPEEDASKQNISPFELIPWLLGQCKTVAQARDLLAHTHVMAMHFSEKLQLSPLHWHIADQKESIVLECMRDGMHIHDNPVHVLTNSPTFDFHMTNLRQYLRLNAQWPVNSFAQGVQLEPFGRGFGGLGLPGDASPASRFVRAAFLLGNSVCEDDENSSVSQFFHLLDSVSMTRGSVRATENRWEITVYTCCINASKGTYYYKCYNNSQITAIHLHHEDLDETQLREFELETNQQIRMGN